MKNNKNYEINWSFLAFLIVALLLFFFGGVFVGSYFNDKNDVAEVYVIASCILSAVFGCFIGLAVSKEEITDEQE